MANDYLEDAGQAERLGDAAEVRQSATAYYREAQRLLMPVGAVWTDRAVYDQRMEDFERIQQKIYALESGAGVTPSAEPCHVEIEAPEETPSEAAVPPVAEGELSVWNFAPGLVVQVRRDFTDYDGQQIRAGEVLHLVDRSYFSYDGGHTLRFAEKTIRLAGLVAEHEPIIANAENAWFLPLTVPPAPE